MLAENSSEVSRSSRSEDVSEPDEEEFDPFADEELAVDDEFFKYLPRPFSVTEKLLLSRGEKPFNIAVVRVQTAHHLTHSRLRDVLSSLISHQALLHTGLDMETSQFRPLKTGVPLSKVMHTHAHTHGSIDFAHVCGQLYSENDVGATCGGLDLTTTPPIRVHDFQEQKNVHSFVFQFHRVASDMRCVARFVQRFCEEIAAPSVLRAKYVDCRSIDQKLFGKTSTQLQCTPTEKRIVNWSFRMMPVLKSLGNLFSSNVPIVPPCFGSKHWRHPAKFIFHQFDENMSSCILRVLNKYKLRPTCFFASVAACAWARLLADHEEPCPSSVSFGLPINVRRFCGVNDGCICNLDFGYFGTMSLDSISNHILSNAFELQADFDSDIKDERFMRRLRALAILDRSRTLTLDDFCDKNLLFTLDHGGTYILPQHDNVRFRDFTFTSTPQYAPMHHAIMDTNKTYSWSISYQPKVIKTERAMEYHRLFIDLAYKSCNDKC